MQLIVGLVAQVPREATLSPFRNPLHTGDICLSPRRDLVSAGEPTRRGQGAVGASASVMQPNYAIDAPFAVAYMHRLRFTRRGLDPANTTLADLIEPRGDGPAPLLAFIDSGVAEHWPDTQREVAAYLGAHGRYAISAGPAVTVPGGEAIKNDPAHVDHILARIRDAKLCRRSYVLAIGGGAVLDAVGYAAAVAHRGIRLIRVPTTTLSQGDSGVGVKNGINAFGRKNYQGVFAPPWAVINDEAYLTTLDPRDMRCGLSEAVKVALVKDAPFFDQIERGAADLAAGDEHALIPVIRRSAELHLRHITEGGDPFEMIAARPLDFGHWSAHKIEQLSGYAVRHGEAVAIGVAVDAVYSSLVGMLAPSDAARIIACLASLGFDLSHQWLARPGDILAGLDEFREHLGGRLTIMLLAGIGRGVDVHAVDASAMSEAMRRVHDWNSSPARSRAAAVRAAPPSTR